MDEFITIRTKDEWGRLSKMEFCVEDIQRAACIFADVHISMSRELMMPRRSPNDSAASTIG